MFKHTTKSEALEETENVQALDSRSLVLKSAIRETNTMTYNPDGSILQFQQIQEEIAQSEALQQSAVQKASTKKELLKKDSSPWNGWIGIGIAGLVILGLLAYFKFVR
jgi:hypothetical protein